ncbi:MAG: hypothetical protein methR_P1702 [Methyloprofundus sp.]|nr:MAG: hypothetical protein methR_P1702 [Methyloprofundus sp.]
MLIKSITYCLLFSCFLVNINGCSLLEVSEEVNKLESAAVIKGQVQRHSSQQGPIIVYRYTLKDKTYIADSYSRTTPSGHYQMDVFPGTYYLAAFIDNNHDGKRQDNEHAGLYSLKQHAPSPITIHSGETFNNADFTISEKPLARINGYSSQYSQEKLSKSIGRLIHLNDPLLQRKNYSMGLWTPLQFIDKVGGGLFFLQEYQANKTPVLFIHGINGGPLDWKMAIESIDEHHFQPWVSYYPSGLRLDMISNYLIKAIALLQDKYQFKKLYIVAHSMGGLVARSTIKKYLQTYPDLADSIQLLITVNSPLAGMQSTEKVERLPIIIPSWRDLKPKSQFLNDLNSWFLPDNIPYHLVFSYLPDEGDDGVVTLQSQIPYKIQENATRIYGFNNSHVGTLKDPSFLNLLHATLEKTRTANTNSVNKGSE